MIDSNSKLKIEINRFTHKASVFATSKILANSAIYQAQDFLVFPEPTYQTVQVNERAHILDVVFAHMNHSCQPTTFIDSNSLIIFAEKDIEVGEEITFFYPSNEWKMKTPFQCMCNAKQCIGNISGAYNLSPTLLGGYRLNGHIARLLKMPHFATLYPIETKVA